MAPIAIEKIKILGAVLEVPAKQHYQFGQFGPTEVNGLDWQCCLAGSSKTAPRILIFSIAIGANSYEVKNSEIWAPAFFKHNNSFIATVKSTHPVNWDRRHLSFFSVSALWASSASWPVFPGSVLHPFQHWNGWNHLQCWNRGSVMPLDFDRVRTSEIWRKEIREILI